MFFTTIKWTPKTTEKLHVQPNAYIHMQQPRLVYPRQPCLHFYCSHKTDLEKINRPHLWFLKFNHANMREERLRHWIRGQPTVQKGEASHFLSIPCINMIKVSIKNNELKIINVISIKIFHVKSAWSISSFTLWSHEKEVGSN